LRGLNNAPPWTGFASVYAALSLFFAAYAAFETRRYPIGTTHLCSLYLCLLLLLALYLAPGFPVSRSWLTKRLHGVRGALVCTAIFLLPYLIYATGTGDFRLMAFSKLLALAALPFGLFGATRVRHPRQMNWQDALVLLWMVVPVLAGQIGGIWNVPVNLDFMVRLFLVGVGSWSFLILRGVADSGYEFRLSPGMLRDTLGDASGNLGAFMIIGLPLGFALHFIAWNPHWRGGLAFAPTSSRFSSLWPSRKSCCFAVCCKICSKVHWARATPRRR